MRMFAPAEFTLRLLLIMKAAQLVAMEGFCGACSRVLQQHVS